MDRVELWEQRRADFLDALARLLSGANQARMSIAASMPGGELKAAAEVWMDLRRATPLRGYPTVDEAKIELAEFLGWA